MDISSICRENRNKRKRILTQRKKKSNRCHMQITNNEVFPQDASHYGVRDAHTSSISRGNRTKRKKILTQSKNRSDRCHTEAPNNIIIHESSSADGL